MKQLKTMLAVAVVAIAMALPSIAAAQYNESRLDHFLDSHPHMKADLSRNPDLIFNKQYRREHPELQKFMQDHPQIYGKLHNHGFWGEYGPDHEWHEADWWHEHDPGWMYEHHPEWAKDHHDWDEDREHHPGWFKHEEKKEHAEYEEHEAAEHHEEAERNEAAEAAEHQHGHHGDHGDQGHGKHGDHDNH